MEPNSKCTWTLCQKRLTSRVSFVTCALQAAAAGQVREPARLRYPGQAPRRGGSAAQAAAADRCAATCTIPRPVGGHGANRARGFFCLVVLIDKQHFANVAVWKSGIVPSRVVAVAVERVPAGPSAVPLALHLRGEVPGADGKSGAGIALVARMVDVRAARHDVGRLEHAAGLAGGAEPRATYSMIMRCTWRRYASSDSRKRRVCRCLDETHTVMPLSCIVSGAGMQMCVRLP